MRDHNQFVRIGGQGTVELGGTVVIAGMLILSVAVEHQFIAGKLIEQFDFGKFAPLAGCGVLKLPVVVAEFWRIKKFAGPILT